MKQLWSKLGGQLGIGCVVAGLLAIGLAWNGAAGVDFVQGQVPYLLSGGAFGLGLIILGATFIVVQNSRRDRLALEAQLRELNGAMARLASSAGGVGTGGDTVVMGRSSFHRPDCRLAQGKDLPAATVEEAMAEGLTPCRICNPATAAA
jgi:hypothetical protein